jgi:hypothetical protein
VRERPERDRCCDRLGDDEAAQPTEGVVARPEDELAERGDVVPVAGQRGRVGDRLRQVAVRDLGAERDEPEGVAADQAEGREKRRERGDGPDVAVTLGEQARNSTLGA